MAHGELLPPGRLRGISFGPGGNERRCVFHDLHSARTRQEAGHEIWELVNLATEIIDQNQASLCRS